MNLNEQNLKNKQNLSEQLQSNNKEEKKTIALEYYKEFKKKYPNFFQNYCIPEAKKPAKLANVNISKKKMANVSINEPQKSVLCGTCLSDSSLSIQPRYGNARIHNRHCTRQNEWFFWKWMVCLKEFTNGTKSLVFQYPDGYQKKAKQTFNEIQGSLKLGKLKIASKASPQLTELNTVLSGGPPGGTEEKNPRKKILRNWLNHMTDYFFMTIWLDDGGLHSNNSSGAINWNSIAENDQKIFVDYLKTVWNINARTVKLNKKMANGQNMYRIVFVDQENLLKFLRIVAPIIPVREMLYKIQFVPVNNTDLLKRWASEVTELVLPEFRDEMKDFYDKTLSKVGKLAEEDIVQ